MKFGPAESHQKGSRERIGELDTLRAVACLSVIAWHVLIHVAAGAPPESRGAWYAASQVFVLGGPVFFFLSALLCFHRHPEGTGLRDFWTRRLLLLGVPYVTWTLVYLLLEVRASHGMSPADVSRAAGLSLLFGVRHLGFLNALMQFYLLFPLLRWLWNRGEQPALTASAFLIGVAWMEGAPALHPQDLPPTVYSAHAGFLPAWLPYVALGALAADHLPKLGRLVPRPAGLWAASLCLLSASGVLLFARSVPEQGGVYAGAARLGVLLAAILWLPYFLRGAMRARESVVASFSRQIVRYAPGLYFAHLLPLTLSAILVPRSWSPWAAFAIYSVVTVYGTALLVRALSRSPASMLILGLIERPREPLPSPALIEEEMPPAELRATG